MDISNKIIKFKDKISTIYKNESAYIIRALEFNIPKSFWIYNPKKTKEILESLLDQGIEVTQSKIDGVFIVEKIKEIPISYSNAFLNKDIYIQELSSLLPVLVLDVKHDENVLDLCASPGSKTLFLNYLYSGKSNIYANEIDKKRFFNMKENFKSYGAENINLLNLDGTKLSTIKPEFINYFDKILVDVPCSSENTLNLKNTDSFKFWNYKKYKSFVKVQKKLLFSAYSMLKPGGTLVYSTCTYSIEENEEVVNSLLEEFGENIEVQNIKNSVDSLKIYNTKPGFIESNRKKYNAHISNSLRILPNENARSFFLCKIKRCMI